MKLTVMPADIREPAMGLSIYVQGFKHTEREQLYIEVYKGKLQIHVFDGDESPSQTIVIEPTEGESL